MAPPAPDDYEDGSVDYSSLYHAVSSGVSAEELRRVIEEYAGRDKGRRWAAVNQSHIGAVHDGETPLQAAHRLKRGDLVGALVEEGADVYGIRSNYRFLTPLAVCIAYGQVESVRALLRGRHKANGVVGWHPDDDTASSTAVHLCLAPPPLGLPSDRVVNGATRIGAPQIGCLEVLLQEGGADVNARDSNRQTPIFWLEQFGCSNEEQKVARDLLVSAGARTSGLIEPGPYHRDFSPLMMAARFNNTRFARFLIEEAGAPVDERRPGGETALHWCWGASGEMSALLLDAGADIEARDKDGRTPLHWAVSAINVARTHLLLDRGASLDARDVAGRTPLFVACEGDSSYRANRTAGWLRDEGWPVFQALMRRSSIEARRAQRDMNSSAIDELAGLMPRWFFGGGSSEEEDPASDEEYPESDEECPLFEHEGGLCARVRSEPLRRRWAIGELLASGVTVRPENADLVLPIAELLSARQESDLAACRAELCSWRAHETFVGVSLDFKELRAMEREAADKRAHVAALEREMEGLGPGTDDTSSSEGSEDDDESESDEEARAETDCSGGGSDESEDGESKESENESDDEEEESDEQEDELASEDEDEEEKQEAGASPSGGE